MSMPRAALSAEDAGVLLGQPVLTSIAGLPIESLADQEPFINGMLIYGQSKIGKTMLACSAGDVPAMCPVLLIDFNEKGTRSARRVKNVTVVKPKTEASLFKLSDALYKGEGGFRTVILDSLSEVQDQMMIEVMKKVVSSPKNNMEDEEVPSMREFGIVLKRLIRLVKVYRDIPDTHVIFTAGASINVNTDERTKPKVITPDFQGKAAFKIPGRMDEVFYYRMRKDPKTKAEKRVLLTAHTEDILAGSRSGELPDNIEDPTMSKLFPLLIEKAKGN